MKVRTLPDWFAPVFGWIITLMVFAAATSDPARVNQDLLWFPPLLAIAWTAGYIGMRRLKSDFREEHEALGHPQLFGSPYEKRHWTFLGWLLNFRFLRLGDAVMSAGFFPCSSEPNQQPQQQRP
jgi:hypothetical protein